MDKPRKWSARWDGWVNDIIGIGAATKDRLMSSYMQSTTTPSYTEYEAMYNEDGLAHRIVNELPEEAMRQGWDLITSSDMDAEQKALEEVLIQNRMAELCVGQHLVHASVLGRLFGGAGLLVVVDGEDDWSAPLDLAIPHQIVDLRSYDRWELTPKTMYSDPMQATFGEVQSYMLTPAGWGTTTEVHASRLLFFGGARTTRRTRATLNYWDNSILRAVYFELRNYGVAWASIQNMLLDTSTGVLKIDRLYEILSGKLKGVLQERLDMLNLGRSSARVLPLDTKEDFTHQERTFTGLSDLLDRMASRIASMTGYPMTKLLGVSPGGLNATGESDTRNWYDVVADFRVRTYTKPLEALVRMVALEQGVTDPESWGIAWPSLWQESPQERTDRQATVCSTDVQYINAGVLSADEVTMARYGTGEWSDAAPQIGVDDENQG